MNDEGFSLIELVVAVGVLAAGLVVALGLLPLLVRASEAGVLAAAATETARNALERDRAAAAYLPAALVADPSTRAASAANHAWAFGSSANATVVARLRRLACGNATGLDVPLTVAEQYDAAADRLTISVGYPQNPCDPRSPTAQVVLSAALVPAQYAPQTILNAPIADPARQ